MLLTSATAENEEPVLQFLAATAAPGLTYNASVANPTILNEPQTSSGLQPENGCNFTPPGKVKVSMGEDPFSKSLICCEMGNIAFRIGQIRLSIC